nr:n-acetyltransferase eso1 [Quercus suber]
MSSDANTSSEVIAVSSPAPVFSSDKSIRSSSPPSSPPGFPWEHHATTEPNDEHGPKIKSPSSAPTKSAFSILGKRKPLCDITADSRPTKKASTNLGNASKPFTQLQISLGQRVQVKCKTCGMEYVSSLKEDRVLHAKFHKENNDGYTVGKDFVRKSPSSQLLEDAEHGGSICAVDCFDKPYRIRHAQNVLTVVERELGAAPLSENAVWLAGTVVGKGLQPPYRAYMYICNAKCMGFLLVQRITKGFAVLEPPLAPPLQPIAKSKQLNSSLAALKARRQHMVDADHDLPLQISSSPSHARVGIARVWVAPAHRHRKIATRLLDVALAHYLPHTAEVNLRDAQEKTKNSLMERHQSIDPVPTGSKTLVAFSQPTAAGTRLARRWELDRNASNELESAPPTTVECCLLKALSCRRAAFVDDCRLGFIVPQLWNQCIRVIADPAVKDYCMCHICRTRRQGCDFMYMSTISEKMESWTFLSSMPVRCASVIIIRLAGEGNVVNANFHTLPELHVNIH